MKIDIISGFPGAGKTTLIRLLCREIYTRGHVTVIENGTEKDRLYGSMPDSLSSSVSSDPPESERITVKHLNGGCICCTASALLTGLLLGEAEQSRDGRVILDPDARARIPDLLTLLQTPALSPWYSPGLIVTVIDASDFSRRLLLSEKFLQTQLHASRFAVLNRTAPLSPEQLEAIRSFVKDSGNCRLLEPAELENTGHLRSLVLSGDEPKMHPCSRRGRPVIPDS